MLSRGKQSGIQCYHPTAHTHTHTQTHVQTVLRVPHPPSLAKQGNVRVRSPVTHCTDERREHCPPSSRLRQKGTQGHDTCIALNGLTRRFWRSVSCHPQALSHQHHMCFGRGSDFPHNLCVCVGGGGGGGLYRASGHWLSKPPF